MKITYFNKAAEKLLKVKEKDVEGKKIFDEVLEEAKNSDFEKKYKKVIKEKKTQHFETYFNKKPYKGWYEVITYPSEEGANVLFQRITERKEAQEAIEKKNKELERFAKVAEGREMKMIEMKKQLRKLKK